MKLSELRAYLKKIQNIYGDMEVEGNIISGDRMALASLCVEDNYKQGYTEQNADNRYNLLVELEDLNSEYCPVLKCYEYPSNKTINID